MKLRAPSSKSYAIRALACSLLAGGKSVIDNVDSCTDVEGAIRAIKAFGARVSVEGKRITVESSGKLRAGRIDIGESGLCARIFACVAAITEGECEVVGSGTILSRSMRSTITAIEALGVEVESSNGFLPLRIRGTAKRNQQIKIDGSDGSQTLSGLLTILPFIGGSVEVENLKSKPYIGITIDMLSRFGVEVKNENYAAFSVTRGEYKNAKVAIEGDWSSASYFVVASEIWGKNVEFEGLNMESCQGDRAIVEAVKRSREEGEFFFDATDCPDLFPSLVALCAVRNGVSVLEGVSRLASKESNRGETLKSEFAKLGVVVNIDVNKMLITPTRMIIQREEIDPHGDHRIAMATAIMGRDIKIKNREVVEKSFSDFWTVLENFFQDE